MRNQLSDQVNAVNDKSDERKALVVIKNDISVETSVQLVTELAECAVLLAISKLNIRGFVSVAVVTSDPELKRWQRNYW